MAFANKTDNPESVRSHFETSKWSTVLSPKTTQRMSQEPNGWLKKSISDSMSNPSPIRWDQGLS